MSGWVATAGGLWSLRLNAPSRWFLASQARMTICKTKIHRSSLRSLEGAGVGLLVLSVMATSHGADAVPSPRISEKWQQTQRKTGNPRQTESACAMGKRSPCDKTHGAGATFCPVRHQTAPNRTGSAERGFSVPRDVALERDGGRGGGGAQTMAERLRSKWPAPALTELAGALDAVAGQATAVDAGESRRAGFKVGGDGHAGGRAADECKRGIRTHHGSERIVHGHQDIEGSSGFEEAAVVSPSHAYLRNCAKAKTCGGGRPILAVDCGGRVG